MSVEQALDMAKKDLSLLREGKMPLHTGEIVEALESDSKDEISIREWVIMREYAWREILLFLLEHHDGNHSSVLVSLRDIMKDWDDSFIEPGQAVE